MMLEEFIKQLEMQYYENLKEVDTDGSTFLPALINITNENYQLLNWLKELQAHREAWTAVANAMKECSYKIWHEFGEYIGEDCEQLEIINLKTALDILEDYRPKEGDNDD